MVTRRGLAGIAAALALWGAPALAQGTLKIGAINPLSGPMALYGDELDRGFELAVERANTAGGVLGRQIQIVRGSATSPVAPISAMVPTYIAIATRPGTTPAMNSLPMSVSVMIP